MNNTFNLSFRKRTGDRGEESLESGKLESWDFHGGPVVKSPPSSSGDASSIPGGGN